MQKLNLVQTHLAQHMDLLQNIPADEESRSDLASDFNFDLG